MTPRTKSAATTASSTHSARPSNSRAHGGSKENELLRDANRWINVIVLPILLGAMITFGTWVVITINDTKTSIAVLQTNLTNGQQQRVSDNTELKNNIGDLKDAIINLTGAVDGLRQSQSTQAASLAVLMDQNQRNTTKGN